MKSISRALSIAQPASPPTEFRIFKAGANETSKGTFIFDATAAKSVMAAFVRQGVDLPIDLDHMSLSDPASANRAPSQVTRTTNTPGRRTCAASRQAWTPATCTPTILTRCDCAW